MKDRVWKYCFSLVLPALVVFAFFTTPLSVSAAETKGTSAEQPVSEEERVLPVGGWAPAEAVFLSEDIEISNGSHMRKGSRGSSKLDSDSVFTKGVSSVGYNALATEAKQSFYRAIDEAATEFMDSEYDLEPTDEMYIVAEVNFYDLGITDPADALQVFYAYDYDHPGYYWISNSLMYSSYNLYLCTEPEYASVETRLEINTLVSAGVKEYAQLAGQETDPLEKIAVVHDKIVNDIDYAYENDGSTPETAKWAHSVQGVFDPQHKLAVCEGYADTFALTMNYLGIPNYYIVGTASSAGAGGGGGHAWNAVSADGGSTYMYMDLTWDDCSEDGYSYQYFGMPASDFETTHYKNDSTGQGSNWLYEITGQLNDSFEGTYYYKGGFYYDGSVSDVSAFVSAAKAKASRAGGWVSFMCPDTNRLWDIADELGMSSLSYYTASYKESSYYYMITPVGIIHSHSWGAPEYTWSSDFSTVTAVRICHAANCDLGTETETVNTSSVETLSCTDAGTITYTAQFKNEAFAAQTKTVSVAPLGHDWGNWTVTKAAGCTEAGEQQRCCSRCALVEKEEHPATGHVYEEAVTKATVSSNGAIETKCTRCGHIKSSKLIHYPKTYALSSTAFTYDGMVKQPAVTVVGADGKTIAASNYDVTYYNNINVGTALAKITFKGSEYSGTKTLSFTINPQGTTISKLTAKKKSFTVKLKKQATQTTGYQIMYSTSSKFASGSKIVTIKKNKTLTKTIKGLKAKKKYYVKIRTYKTVNGTDYYSAWSGKKSVKTK